MKLFQTLCITALILVFSSGLASAQTLLIAVRDSCDSGSGAGNATLHRVDPNTAISVPIGAIDFPGVSAMAQLPDGRLVASARADDNGNKISILIEVNPANGNSRLIGTIGNQAGGGCGRVPGMTYDPVTGTLFGLGIHCASQPSNFVPLLLSIDPDTGAATSIGSLDIENAGLPLAADSNGNLFSAGCCGPGNESYSVNPQTGLATILADLGPNDPPLFNSYDFQPDTGVLFGTLNDFPDAELATVNPFSGDVNIIGDLPDCTDGIVFFRNFTRPIPTLSEWGFIVMAGLLGIAGAAFFAYRKKQALQG